MTDALRDWVAARNPRERRLLALAALLLALVAAWATARAVHADLAGLETRVAARTRELERVRRLAAAARSSAVAASAGSLLGRLESVAATTVGRERIAAMTPAGVPGAGGAAERVALRLAGASLPETVRLLHALAADAPDLTAERLEMRKHADDPGRFAVTVEVRAAPGTGAER